MLKIFEKLLKICLLKGKLHEDSTISLCELYLTDAYQSEREIKIYVKNFHVLILRKCICLSSQTEFVINREKSAIAGKKAKLFEFLNEIA